MAMVRSEMQMVPVPSQTEQHTKQHTKLYAADAVHKPYATSMLAGHLFWRLYQLGVDHMFGVPGDYALGLLSILEKSPIKYIGTCNELNAGYAADGYARIRGLGACIVTYGVGELSALNAIAGSFAERIPTVVIVGVPPTTAYAGGKLLHHTMGDYHIPFDIYQKVTCAQALITDPLAAPQQIDHVLSKCLYHHQPVYIAIPSDLIFEHCHTVQSPFPIIKHPPSNRDALIEAIDEAAEMLNHAHHPIIIVDAMVRRCKLQREVLHLIESSGIPFVSTMMGKALISEQHPQFIGLYAGAHSRQQVRERVEGADCVLMIGPVLSDFNTGGFSSKLETRKLIEVHTEQVKIKHHTYRSVLMADMIEALNMRVVLRTAEDVHLTPASGSCVHRPYNWNQNVPFGTTTQSPFMTTRRFFDYISQMLPRDSVVIADVGESLFSLAETLMPEGATFVSQAFYGSIGYTIGATLGVCAALQNSPSRHVFLFVGDGSLQVSCQDLGTMIHNEFTPCVFVLNNGGYSIERCILDGAFNSISPWKYHLLPLVFGGKAGSDVYDEANLHRVASAALEDWRANLHLIEVHVNKDDTSETMRLAGRSMAETTQVVKSK